MGSGTEYLSQQWNKQNSDWDVTKSWFYYLFELPNIDLSKFSEWGNEWSYSGDLYIQIQLMGTIKAEKWTRLFISINESPTGKSWNLYL